MDNDNTQNELLSVRTLLRQAIELLTRQRRSPYEAQADVDAFLRTHGQGKLDYRPRRVA